MFTLGREIIPRHIFQSNRHTRSHNTCGVGRQVGGYNIKTSPDKTNYTPPVSQVFTVCRAALYVTRPILSRDQLKLPELNGEFRAAGRQASKATHVSNPDCFARSVSVSLRPASTAQRTPHAECHTKTTCWLEDQQVRKPEEPFLRSSHHLLSSLFVSRPLIVGCLGKSRCSAERGFVLLPLLRKSNCCHLTIKDE